MADYLLVPALACLPLTTDCSLLELQVTLSSKQLAYNAAQKAVDKLLDELGSADAAVPILGPLVQNPSLATVAASPDNAAPATGEGQSNVADTAAIAHAAPTPPAAPVIAVLAADGTVPILGLADAPVPTLSPPREAPGVSTPRGKIVSPRRSAAAALSSAASLDVRGGVEPSTKPTTAKPATKKSVATPRQKRTAQKTDVGKANEPQGSARGVPK